nr:MFS transporter [uncultured Schaedlerella sp.]
MKPTINFQKATMAEKIWFSLGNMGVQLSSLFVMMYISIYYTNNVGIAAAAVGMIMMISKITDGISDLLFAWVMEKTHFKMGKARPWLLISAPLMGLSMLLCFNIPSTLTDTGKVVYALLTYSFMQAVGITVFWLSYNTLFPLLTQDPQDRNWIQGLSNALANGAGMLISLLAPMAFVAWGGITEPGCWSKVSIIIAILTTVLIAISAFVCKEKESGYYAETAGVNEVAKKEESRRKIKLVFTSKMTWIVMIIFTLYNMNVGLSGFNSYMCIYLLGDTSMAFMGRVSMIVTVLSMIVSLMIVPPLFKKIGRTRVVMISVILSCAGFGAMFFFGRTTVGYAICQIVANTVINPLNIAVYTYVADLTDMFARKHKENVASLCAVSGSFGTKIGAGIGAALVGWILAWVGFDATAAQLSESVLMGILAGGSLPRVIVLFICLVFVLIFENMMKKETQYETNN